MHPVKITPGHLYLNWKSGRLIVLLVKTPRYKNDDDVLVTWVAKGRDMTVKSNLLLPLSLESKKYSANVFHSQGDYEEFHRVLSELRKRKAKEKDTALVALLGKQSMTSGHESRAKTDTKDARKHTSSRSARTSEQMESESESESESENENDRDDHAVDKVSSKAENGTKGSLGKNNGTQSSRISGRGRELSQSSEEDQNLSEMDAKDHKMSTMVTASSRAAEKKTKQPLVFPKRLPVLGKSPVSEIGASQTNGEGSSSQKRCKCGSTTHQRISSRFCRLNSKSYHTAAGIVPQRGSFETRSLQESSSESQAIASSPLKKQKRGGASEAENGGSRGEPIVQQKVRRAGVDKLNGEQQAAMLEDSNSDDEEVEEDSDGVEDSERSVKQLKTQRPQTSKASDVTGKNSKPALKKEELTVPSYDSGSNVVNQASHTANEILVPQFPSDMNRLHEFMQALNLHPLHSHKISHMLNLRGKVLFLGNVLEMPLILHEHCILPTLNIVRECGGSIALLGAWRCILEEDGTFIRVWFVDPNDRKFSTFSSLLKALGLIDDNVARLLSQGGHEGYVQQPQVAPRVISTKLGVATWRGQLMNAPQYLRFDTLIPVGFEYVLHWFAFDENSPELLTAEEYTIIINPGPSFSLYNQARVLLAKSDSPDGLWRIAVQALLQNYLKAFYGMKTAISLSHATKKQSSLKNIGPKPQMSALMQTALPVYSSHPLFSSSKAQREIVLRLSEPGRRLGVVLEEIQVRGESGQTGTKVVAAGFDGGYIGEPLSYIRVGDVFLSMKLADEDEWKPVSSAEQIKSAGRGILFVIVQYEVDPKTKIDEAGEENTSGLATLSSMLLCGEGSVQAATPAQRKNAFMLGAMMCGILDSKFQVQTLLETALKVRPNPLYRFSHEQKGLMYGFDLASCATVEHVIVESRERVKQRLLNLYSFQKHFRIACKTHMKAEEKLSRKALQSQKSGRGELRKEVNRLTLSIMPNILKKAELSKSEQKRLDNFAKSFLLPPGESRALGDEFTLEPMYDCFRARLKREEPERDIDSLSGETSVVLDALIGRIELPYWTSNTKGGLTRSIARHGSWQPTLHVKNLTKYVNSDSVSAPLLSKDEASVHTLCLSRELERVGYASDGTRKRVKDTSVSHAGQQDSSTGTGNGTNEPSSSKISATVARVVRKIVLEVVKGHKEWERDQRAVATSRKRLLRIQAHAQQKLPSYFDSCDYAVLCAGVEAYGPDWVSILADDSFSQLIRPPHRSAAALEKAWRSLDAVVAVHGNTGNLYPLMGFYAKLTPSARQAAKSRRGPLYSVSPKGDSKQNPELVYIGVDRFDVLASRLMGNVSIRTGEDLKTWVVGPSGPTSDSAEAYLVFELLDAPRDVVDAEDLKEKALRAQTCLQFSSSSWKVDTDTKLTVLKLPSTNTTPPTPRSPAVLGASSLSDPADGLAGPLDILPENISQEEAVEKIKNIIATRRKLVQAQVVLEELLDAKHVKRLVSDNSIISGLCTLEHPPNES